MVDATAAEGAVDDAAWGAAPVLPAAELADLVGESFVPLALDDVPVVSAGDGDSAQVTVVASTITDRAMIVALYLEEYLKQLLLVTFGLNLVGRGDSQEASLR